MSTWRTWRAMPLIRYVLAPHRAVNAPRPCAWFESRAPSIASPRRSAREDWDGDDAEDGLAARDRARPRAPRRRNGARREPVPRRLQAREADVPRGGDGRFLDG